MRTGDEKLIVSVGVLCLEFFPRLVKYDKLGIWVDLDFFVLGGQSSYFHFH